MNSPAPAVGRPWKPWWVAALLTAVWAGLALANVVQRDGPPPGTSGVRLARRVVEDLVRKYPAEFAGWRPFDEIGARRPADAGTISGVVASTYLGETPREVQPALRALFAAWSVGPEAGRDSWSRRGPEPLDPDLVAVVEKALELDGSRGR